MYHTIQAKTKTNNGTIDQVVRAVTYLRELGFPLLNIRRALPKLTGVTNTMVAEKLGITRAAVTHAMNSERHNPYLQQDIAAVYGVDRHMIFETPSEMPFHQSTPFIRDAIRKNQP